MYRRFPQYLSSWIERKCSRWMCLAKKLQQTTVVLQRHLRSFLMAEWIIGWLAKELAFPFQYSLCEWIWDWLHLNNKTPNIHLSLWWCTPLQTSSKTVCVLCAYASYRRNGSRYNFDLEEKEMHLVLIKTLFNYRPIYLVKRSRSNLII